MSNNPGRTLAAIISGVLAAAAAPAVVAAEGSKPELENIVVTGTRVADRSATETSVPVDIVSADALANVGVTELNQALSSVLPSYNFPRPGLADGTDTIRPVAKGQYEPTPSLVIPSLFVTLGLSYPRGATSRHSHATAGGRI